MLSLMSSSASQSEIWMFEHWFMFLLLTCRLIPVSWRLNQTLHSIRPNCWKLFMVYFKFNYCFYGVVGISAWTRCTSQGCGSGSQWFSIRWICWTNLWLWDMSLLNSLSHSYILWCGLPWVWLTVSSRLQLYPCSFNLSIGWSLFTLSRVLE